MGRRFLAFFVLSVVAVAAVALLVPFAAANDPRVETIAFVVLLFLLPLGRYETKSDRSRPDGVDETSATEVEDESVRLAERKLWAPRWRSRIQREKMYLVLRLEGSMQCYTSNTWGCDVET